ncbi:MAG: hydroxymethylglutaryl-CoA reductase, degradative [Myxococcota bacterium]
MSQSSRIPGFYKLPPDKRLRALESRLTSNEVEAYRTGLSLEAADLMVENVISTFGLPCAVAMNFLINGREHIVPMVVEEPSVVAAVSNVARLARDAGGFTAWSDPAHMIGQIQLVPVADPARCMARLHAALPTLREHARGVHPRLEERGGGVVDFEVRHLTYDEPGHPREEMVVLHVVLDVVDAMGANMVNTLAEHLAPLVAEITGEPLGLRILSNLADRRRSGATVSLPPEALSTDTLDGAVVAERIAQAWRFAWADPYRAATHNKGVMNGIDSVAIATGNDWRAIEAGAHAWCCRDGQYRPMTRWEIGPDGRLNGSIELPLQFGTVGGPIRVHPTVQSNLKLLGVKGAQELAGIAVAVGLAQNLGALKALATEGIQNGHMRMHARTVAATAGARPHEITPLTTELVRSGDYSVDRARLTLERLRRGP